MNKHYSIKFQVFDLLLQKIMIDTTDFYQDAAEATYDFIEKAGKFIDSGLTLVFKDADEQGYMEEHYSDGRNLAVLILNID